jgi:D-alanyl-D-alanine carboxypeptidase
LADEGHLNVDNTLDSYVPGVLGGDRITVRHLLAMTSDVANFLEDSGFLEASRAKPEVRLSPRTHSNSQAGIRQTSHRVTGFSTP